MPTRSTRRNATRVTHDENINTSGMAQAAIDILMLALDLGWEAQVQKNGSMMLFREHEGRAVSIILPTNTRNIKESISKSWTRKAIRYGDPVKLALITEAYNNYDSDDLEKRNAAQIILKGLRTSQIRRDPASLARIIGMEGGGNIEDWVHNEAERIEAQVEAVAEEVGEAVERAFAGEPEGPQVVKVKPWTARHSMRREGGEVYPSRAVLERKWSDGSTDYLCAFEGCDFTSPDKPQTVAAHYGGKHGKERPATQNLAEAYVDPNVRWTPTERQKGRIHRLEKEIREAAEEIGWGDVTPALLAEYIVKRRDQARDALTDEVTELTDEQVLDRIRRLIDRGAYADLLARVEQVEAECQAKVEQAREQLSSKERGATNAIRTLEKRLEEAKAEYERVTDMAHAETVKAQEQARQATEKWQSLVELVREG